jgi:hypothetical protein
MATIELDHDNACNVVRDVLVEDYLRLSDQIISYESRGEELKPFELEDFNSWLKTVAAIDSLFDWYLSSDDAKDIRAQGRKI